MVKKILVVDDEVSIALICERVLIAEGHSVDTARNGIEGKERIEEKDYDLVILDIRTPLMDGEELYRCICENHPKLRDRVIFNTGAVLGGSTPEFLKKCSRPFIPKPFTPDELKEAVRKFFKSK